MTNEFEVFLCEDIDDGDEIQRQLDACRAGRPRLRIVDQARTFDDARDLLLDRERFPDLVLIDDRLQRGADARPRPSALELATFIWEERRREGLETQTRSVLWTASEDPLLFWTFRVCGGWHIMSKSLTPWEERTQRLYDVLGGEQWWPEPPTLHLQPAQREVIRFFHAGFARAETAQRLGVSAATVANRASELRRTLVEQLGDAFVPNGEVALANVAKDAGWVWVRPQHDRLLPALAPLPLVLDPAMIPRA